MGIYDELIATQQQNQQLLGGMQARQQQAQQAQQNRAPSGILGTIQSEQQYNAERKSALGIIDRFKYGFADDEGKKNIIYQATGKMPTQLKNGEYGVEDVVDGKKVYRPVDPKGFQMSDVISDIGESVGKALPTIGSALGGSAGLVAGGVGSIGGAGAGAAGGEFARQKLGELLGVRKGGMDNKDFMELATEGLMGSAGQGMALGVGKLLQTLAKPIAAPLAQNADDLAKGIRPGTTEVSNVLSDDLGLKNVNSEITKRFNAQPNKFRIVNNIDEMAASVDDKLTKVIENKNEMLFQKHLEPELQKVAQAQGVNNLDEVALDMSTAVNDLDTLLSKVKNDKTLTATQKAQQSGVIQEYADLVRANPEATYGQFKSIGKNLNDLVVKARNDGDFTTQKGLSQIYDTLVENRAKTLNPDAFKNYAKERKAFSKLDELFKVKMTDGEIKAGQISLVGKLGKLADEVKQSPNYNKLQSIIEEGKKSGIPEMGELGDSIDEYLYNHALSKAKAGKGALAKVISKVPVIGGLGDVTNEIINDPRNKARLYQKMFQTGIMDPSKLGERVSETAIPRIQTLSTLLNAKRLLSQGVPLPEVLKTVPKPVAKAIRATYAKTKGGVAGAAIGRSFNSILNPEVQNANQGY